MIRKALGSVADDKELCLVEEEEEDDGGGKILVSELG